MNVQSWIMMGIEYMMGGGDNILNEPKDVVFGNDIWMGNGCMILKGSVIPSGCIIASRSLISKPLNEENSIITSQERTLKSNIRWKR